jgi:hypothetical protein
MTTAVRAFVALRDSLSQIAREGEGQTKMHAWAAYHHLMSIPSPDLHRVVTANIERCFAPDQLPRSLVGREEIRALRRIWGELSERKARHDGGEYWRSWTEDREAELNTIRLLLDAFGVDPEIPE